MSFKTLLLAAVTAILLAVQSPANATTITFDELTPQPVDGLTFNGVTFGFTVGGSPSTDAFFNVTFADFGIPGEAATNINDSALFGLSEGVLSLAFLAPVTTLSFGVAIADFGPFSPGFTVSLFDDLNILVGEFPVDTDSLVLFSEGLFSYSGSPIGSATVAFADVGAFVLDNLTFSGATEVPEPATLAILGLGLLGIAGLRRRRRAA